jgi:hypothetical protein
MKRCVKKTEKNKFCYFHGRSKLLKVLARVKAGEMATALFDALEIHKK